MKVVILAGGFGTRLSEETVLKPKPMVEIGPEPILWHIMKIYSHYGFNDFVICLGYKGYVVKEYFNNYYLHNSDVSYNLQNNEIEIHGSRSDPWKVTLIDTGIDTMTGGRLKRVKKYLGNETFMMTYGDGLSNVNIKDLVAHHQNAGRIATLTAVRPSGRFGVLKISEKQEITSFQEKPEGDSSWVNGGFFVLEPSIFEHISDDTTIFEREPLEKLSSKGQLGAYCHDGFWMPMDKLSDKKILEEMWVSGKARWKVW